MNATQRAIVKRLSLARDAFVSGEELAQELGLSRAAIAKAVDGLRAAGYAIDSRPHRGHRLVARPDLLFEENVHDGLQTTHLGRVIQHYDHVASTQSTGRMLAIEGAGHGTVVVAERQTAGRGRLNRRYESPCGGIWCTTILRRPVAPSSAPLISLAAGVAVAEGLLAQAAVPVTLKWPNDVLVNNRKVSGTLTEMVAEESEVSYLLVGTGINVNVEMDDLPQELREIATTMKAETGRPLDRTRLLQDYLRRFEELSESVFDADYDTVPSAWKALPNSIGCHVTATTRIGSVSGLAIGLTETGALIVETESGDTEWVVAGDVVHTRLTPGSAS